MLVGLYLAGVAFVAGGLWWLLGRIDGDHLDRHTAAVIAGYAITWPLSVPLTVVANLRR